MKVNYKHIKTKLTPSVVIYCQQVNTENIPVYSCILLHRSFKTVYSILFPGLGYRTCINIYTSYDLKITVLKSQGCGTKVWCQDSAFVALCSLLNMWLSGMFRMFLPSAA